MSGEQVLGIIAQTLLLALALSIFPSLLHCDISSLMPLPTQLQAVLAVMNYTLKQLAKINSSFLRLLLVKYLITAMCKVINLHPLLFLIEPEETTYFALLPFSECYRIKNTTACKFSHWFLHPTMPLEFFPMAKQSAIAHLFSLLSKNELYGFATVYALTCWKTSCLFPYFGN